MIPNWALWVAEDIRDLKIGADIKVEELPKLSDKDRIRGTVDQSYGIYKMACTFLSSYTAILSLWNMQSNEKEKEEIVYDAVKFDWYTIWQGRWTQMWVRRACKTWNRLHPDKPVWYAQIVIGSPERKEALEKGYMIVTTYNTSSQYYYDIMDDGIVQRTKTSWYTWWHAICAVKSDREDMDCMHHNTYPKWKYNDYYVQHFYDLVKNDTYYPTGYIIFEDRKQMVKYLLEKKFENELMLKEKIKERLIHDQMAINSKLWKMAKSQETKDRLHEMNEYRRANWF